MAFDYLLPIDSKNPNYQFIHLDLDHGFGIACKFDFTAKNSTFTITHSKIVLTCPNDQEKTCYFPCKSISSIKSVQKPNTKYKWQIEVNIETDTSRKPDVRLPEIPINDKYKIKKNDELLSIDHIVDVKIDDTLFPFKKKTDKDGIRVKFGSHFCKFYITS